MDPPRRPGAAGGTVKPWPGGSRGLPRPRPPRHLTRPPAAAAPARDVAAAWPQRGATLAAHAVRRQGYSRWPRCVPCNMRANCLHSVLRSVKGEKGQSRERVGQTRSTRGPGEQGNPKSTSDEGERSEEAGMPRTMLCTVRSEREGSRGGTQPAHGGGRAQAKKRRGERVPRKLLCTVRVRDRADSEEPRGHTKGERQRKGASEKTGTKGEHAAQRVVHLVRTPLSLLVRARC